MKKYWPTFKVGYLLIFLLLFFVLVDVLFAGSKKIHNYSDTLSDSKPSVYSNHTFVFEPQINIDPSGYLEVNFPSDFEVPATSTFAERNVELIVDGTPRVASTSLSPTEDQVVITTGLGGTIRYNLNPTTGISAGQQVQFKIGEHTSNAIEGFTSYSTSTGTTTVPNDVGIINSATLGRHDIRMDFGGIAEEMYAEFVVFLLAPVGIENVDTTEDVPPLRFNGAPSGEISGTTQNVEVSVETDEFAFCRYSTDPDIAFSAMTSSFTSTGLLVHTFELPVSNNTTYNFYIRCIDDEGNFNIDDYLINFNVPEPPEGEPNPDGDGNDDGDGGGEGDNNDGDGSGGGNSDSGSGSGSSGGSGGGGGGGGGGSGGDDDADEAGGPSDGAYQSGDATVIISGYSFPRSKIYLLVDGKQALTGTAGSDGKFTLTVPQIARGVYTFGIYATDADNTKSSTFSTTFSVQGARTSNLSNVNIMPSIKVTPNPVNPGSTVKFSGYALANSVVTIENQKDKSTASLKSFTANANAQGAWSLDVDTAGFTTGTYKVRAKSAQDGGVSTNFSGFTFYGVGQKVASGINSDLNRDGKVNLVDFSILLFWWGSSGGASDPPADINGDGTVSLTDFSILLFNWTG